MEAAKRLPSDTAQELLTSAREAFVHGLALAAGVGAAVLLATAAAAWFLLRGQRLDGSSSQPSTIVAGSAPDARHSECSAYSETSDRTHDVTR